MMSWVNPTIEKASWKRFLVWFAMLFVFSLWAFNLDSPWTRALDLACGVLPETKPGIPAIEPIRSLDALGGNTGDYLLWQLLDIPYAVMNLMVTTTGIALGLKAMRLGSGFWRGLIILPMLYLICELVENSFLAAFASKLLTPCEPIVLLQQLATTLKFASGFPAMAFGALGVVIALLASLIKSFRKNT